MCNLSHCLSLRVVHVRGRFSVVTQCQDSQSQQLFAAKITPCRPEKRQLVLREYQLLKRLNHPNLVQLHTAYITPYYLVLIQELCAGRELLYNLAERSDRHTIEYDRCLLYITTLLSSVWGWCVCWFVVLAG